MTDLIEENNPILAPESAPLVAILMGTKNGARFLSEQLDSLELQTHENWVLIVSDDGSTDDTRKILQVYQAKWPTGKLIIREGPNQGFCINFLTMACDPIIRADYYAFCDQDDVWLPNKLTLALKHIRTNEFDANKKSIPFLYCSRTLHVTENLRRCGKSPLFVFPPSFRNALVQSLAGGNTMVFNQQAKALLEKGGVKDVPSHDWWAYLLISGADGSVYYDPRPHILYRQHPDSAIGGNNSLISKFRVILNLLKGRFQECNTQNILALESAHFLLDRHHQEVLKLFIKMRSAKLMQRFRLMEVCGLYRQTRRGTVSLYFAALFKKI